MGYRIKEHRPHRPNRTMQDTVTPYRIFLENGQTSIVAVPCFYQEVRPPIPVHHHCRPWHDHVGWPSPSHPDHSCQDWDFATDCTTVAGREELVRACDRYIDLGRLIPIHFSEEYEKNDFEINVVDEEGKADADIEASASLDEHDDWVIRMQISANKTMKPGDDPVKRWFSLFHIGDDDRRTLVSKGAMIVMPVFMAE